MKALIYARGSEASIEYQIENCKKHCLKNNIEIANCYYDEGILPSARESKFKGFLKLLEDLKDTDCIACMDNKILPDFYKKENSIIDNKFFSYFYKGAIPKRKIEYCCEHFLDQQKAEEWILEIEVERRVQERLNMLSQGTQSTEAIKEYLLLKNKVMARLVTDGCVRNSFIEELHGGKSPITKTGDYSDVKVVFPGGEIAWPELSKISDQEMRKMMIEIENNMMKIFNLFFIEHTHENIKNLSCSVMLAAKEHSYLTILNDNELLKGIENFLFSTSGVSWDNPNPYYDASAP